MPVTFEEIVVTATRREQPSFEVPRAVTTVSQAVVDEQAPAVLADLMRGQVGAYVQQTGPGQGTPVVRGLLGSSVLVLVDGMRLNTAFFRAAPNQYFALVDPYNVERLEMVRGVASTLYGSDAMGGVINVITPTPQFDGEQWQLSGKSVSQFSSADLGSVARLSLAGGKSGLAVSAGATYQNHDDLRSGSGKQHPSAYDVFAADGKLAFGGPAQDAILSVQYLRQDKTPRFDELVPGFGQTAPSSAVFFFAPNDRLFVHGQYRHYDPLPHVGVAKLDIAFQEINDDRRARDFGSTREDRERNRSRLIGITAEATSPVYDLMTVTYGADVYLDQIDSSRVGRDIETGVAVPRPSRFAAGSTLNSYAVYVQDEVFVHPRLTATLGGRLSYFDESIPPADRGVGTSRHITDLTGNVGLLYRVTEAWHAVANVGRGFRVPNVFDLSTLGSRPGNRFSVPNSNLSSEQLLGTDVGVKLKTAAVQGEIVGFYSYYDAKIEDLPTGAITPEGRRVVSSQNANSVDLFGIEAGASVALGSRADGFSVLNFTWGRETLGDGATSPGDRIPPVNGRAGISYRPRRDVVMEPFLSWAAAQDRLSTRDQTDPRINPDGTPGWLTINFRSRWDAHERVRVRLEIDNILDKDYREHGSGIDAAGINAIAALELRL